MTGLPAWLDVAARPRWEGLRDHPDWRAIFTGVWSPGGPASRLAPSRIARTAQLIVATADQMEADLAGTDWPGVASDDVVAVFAKSLATDIAVRRMVPPDVARDRLARTLVFVETLIRSGLLIEDALGIEGAAVEQVLNHLVGYAAGPLAWNEITRRATAHEAGVAAALLRLCHELRVDGVLDHDDPVEVQAVATLEDAIRRQLQRQLRRASPTVQRDARDDATGQIALTIAERWGAFDPLDAISRALGGGFDIVPRAVADDVVDQIRKIERRRDHEHSAGLGESLLVRITEFEDGRVLHPALAPASADETRADEKALLERYRTSSAQGQRDVEMLLDARTQAAQALARSVTDRHVRRQRAQALARFKAWRRQWD
jgi:hypothetical protein